MKKKKKLNDNTLLVLYFIGFIAPNNCDCIVIANVFTKIQIKYLKCYHFLKWYCPSLSDHT